MSFVILVNHLNEKPLRNKLKGFSALLFSGCAQYQNVSTKRVLKINFADYHSYSWLAYAGDSCDKIPDTMPVGAIVEGAVEEELNCRGYSFDSDRPDILLKMTVCHKKKEEYPHYPYPWSFSFVSSRDLLEAVPSQSQKVAYPLMQVNSSDCPEA